VQSSGEGQQRKSQKKKALLFESLPVFHQEPPAVRQRLCGPESHEDAVGLEDEAQEMEADEGNELEPPMDIEEVNWSEQFHESELSLVRVGSTVATEDRIIHPDMPVEGAKILMELVDVHEPQHRDEYTFEVLPTAEVAQAIRDELQSLEDLQAFEFVYDRKPSDIVIGTRFVIHRKATGRVKARLVVQEFQRSGMHEDLFAPTPSLLSLRLLMVLSVKRQWEMWLGDISTAFAHVPLDREPRTILIPPPGIFPAEVRLWALMSLNGLRKGPQNFSEFWATLMMQIGMIRMATDPQVFVGKQGSLLLAYVDDLVLVGPKDEREYIMKAISDQVKMKWLGKVGDQEARFLGRSIARLQDPDRYVLWMTRSYFQRMTDLMGLQGVKCTYHSPMAADKSYREDKTPPLTPNKAALYRRIVGMLLWCSQIRADLTYTVRELSRHVQNPTELNWSWLRHVLIYIKGHPMLAMTVQHFVLGEVGAANDTCIVTGHCDAGWAGAPGQKSVTGWVVAVDGAVVSLSSKTQALTALSSTEAEIVSMTSASQELLFVSQWLSEAGYSTKLVLYGDNSAALALAARRGPGRIRHLALRHMWLQELYRDKKIEFRKVHTMMNRADCLTKRLSIAQWQRALQQLEYVRIKKQVAKLGSETVVTVPTEAEEPTNLDVIEMEVHSDISEYVGFCLLLGLLVLGGGYRGVQRSSAFGVRLHPTLFGTMALSTLAQSDDDEREQDSRSTDVIMCLAVVGAITVVVLFWRCVKVVRNKLLPEAYGEKARVYPRGKSPKDGSYARRGKF
jgi:hypothetical protein